jgi:hypothetical protein
MRLSNSIFALVEITTISVVIAGTNKTLAPTTFPGRPGTPFPTEGTPNPSAGAITRAPFPPLMSMDVLYAVDLSGKSGKSKTGKGSKSSGKGSKNSSGGYADNYGGGSSKSGKARGGKTSKPNYTGYGYEPVRRRHLGSKSTPAPTMYPTLSPTMSPVSCRL